MKNLLSTLSILILFSIIYSQCDHDEAELWGICYSIENTIVLNNMKCVFDICPTTFMVII